MRRVVQAVVAGKPIGDVTTLEDEASVDEVNRTFLDLKQKIESRTASDRISSVRIKPILRITSLSNNRKISKSRRVSSAVSKLADTSAVEGSTALDKRGAIEGELT